MSTDTPSFEAVRAVVNDALADMKAVNPVELDVRGRTAITDLMVVASGTSSRHVKSVADRVVEKAKAAGIQPTGVEGAESAEWILVDLGDVVVHVMSEYARSLYRLEHIWSMEEEEELDQGSGT